MYCNFVPFYFKACAQSEEEILSFVCHSSCLTESANCCAPTWTLRQKTRLLSGGSKLQVGNSLHYNPTQLALHSQQLLVDMIIKPRLHNTTCVSQPAGTLHTA